MAQDNGFLDLIINNKEKQQESVSSSTSIIHASASPQTPPQQQPHSDITYLIHQAKLNGWNIEPHEVIRTIITFFFSFSCFLRIGAFLHKYYFVYSHS